MTAEHPARLLYREGRRFRVVKEGARLEGIVTFGTGGTSWAGFSRHLKVGELVQCLGWKPMMGTPSEGAMFESDSTPPNAVWSMVWPMNGLFQPFPMDGYLQWEPSADDDETGWPEEVTTVADALAAQQRVAALPTEFDPVNYTAKQQKAREVWETIRGQEEVSLGALRKRLGTDMAVIDEVRRLIAAEVLTKVIGDGMTWLRPGAKFYDPTPLIAGREIR